MLEIVGGPIRNPEQASPHRQDYLAVVSIGAAGTALSVIGLAGIRRSVRPFVLAGLALFVLAAVPSEASLPFRYPVRMVLPAVAVGLPLLAAFGWSRLGGGIPRLLVAFATLPTLLCVLAGIAMGSEPAPLWAAQAVSVATAGLLMVGPTSRPSARPAFFQIVTPGLIPLLLAGLSIAETTVLASQVPSFALPDELALASPPLAERAERRHPGFRVMADPPRGPALLFSGNDLSLRYFERSRLLAFAYGNLLGSSHSVQGGGPLLLERYESYMSVAFGGLGRLEPLLAALHVGSFVSLARPPVRAEIRPVGQLEGAILSEWDESLPRAWIVDDWRPAKDASDSRRQLEDPALDLEHTAVVEGVDLPPRPPHPSSSRWKLVRQTRDEPERIELEVDTSHGGLLVLADAWYPGWTATVSGRPVPVHPTNLLMRGVLLPGGPARVVFAYRPLSFRIGLLAGVMGVLGFLVSLAYDALRARSKRQEERLAPC